MRTSPERDPSRAVGGAARRSVPDAARSQATGSEAVRPDVAEDVAGELDGTAVAMAVASHRAVTPGDLVGAYRRRRRGRTWVVVVLLVPLAAASLWALLVGGASYGLRASWDALLAGLGGAGVPEADLAQRIVWQLRVPRVAMAIVGGMALALAGMLMQTILRNPLASPYTLGIASAASFGAAFAIILRSSVLAIWGTVPYDWVIVTNAFVFAFLATAVIYLLARMQRVTPETIVLLGIAMMFLFSALTALLQYLGDPDQMAELAYWMFGSLNRATWTKLGITAIVAAVGIAVTTRWTWDLNALMADDDTARSAGIDVGRRRLQGLALASLLTATVVSFLGPIGFIGLVAPHLGRLLVGADHRMLLPTSLLLGAIVLVVADIAARTLAAPVTIPVGILTAFVGVPTLLFLMLRRTREHW